jgi:methionyl-tRNA synthetase
MMDLFDRMWTVQDAISKYNFRDGLKAMLDISTAGNQILQFNEPWKTIKKILRLSGSFKLCLQYVAALSLAMFPFMPNASGRLRKLLNLEPIQENGAWVVALDALANGDKLVETGHAVNQPEHLFSRVEDEWIKKQVDKLHAMSDNTHRRCRRTGQLAEADISYEDFAKLDIRTAKIVAAERVPKADKF